MTTSERPDQQPETLSPQPPSQPIGGTGRLAQVIATRGGLAPPEAPFVIEHREALIYMLCEAAELEHGIMCQYLFAVFSLKQDNGEGLTEAELAATRRWRKVISRVATQEMLHLALVQNLLTAIGAAPHLSRPNFPHPSGHYPAGVHLALLPFGEEAVRHFMFLERPEGMDIRDADGMAAFGRAQPLMEAGDIVPRGQDFKTIGHMYRSIEAGFRHLAGQHGEDWLFVGPPRAQATPDYFGWPELIPVTDLASAQRAIDEILEQGEGPRGAWQEAHFGQFVEVLDEYLQAKEANLGLEATRPVQTVNVRPCDQDVEVPLCSDQVTARVMDLFNVAYEVLLQIFERFFAHTDESDTQLKTLADATVTLMLRVIKPLGDLITTLPAGSDYPGQTAGPASSCSTRATTCCRTATRPGRCWPSACTWRPGSLRRSSSAIPAQAVPFSPRNSSPPAQAIPLPRRNRSPRWSGGLRRPGRCGRRAGRLPAAVRSPLTRRDRPGFGPRRRPRRPRSGRPASPRQ